MKTIKDFRGEYFFLSNFYHRRIELDGNIYNSVECAYQAMKCKTKEERKQFVGLNSVEAKKLGKTIDVRSNWSNERKSVMFKLLLMKFSKPSLARRLKETGNAIISHENVWKDTYWGVCDGKGKDILGKMLMQIRDIIEIPEPEHPETMQCEAAACENPAITSNKDGLAVCQDHDK